MSCRVMTSNLVESRSADVRLLCVEDGVELASYRATLSACSHYFKKLFNWNKQDVIEVHNGITGKILQNILKYADTNEIMINLENVTDLLIAASYFTMVDIVEDCIKFILHNLEISSCIDMLLFSIHFDVSMLKNGIISFIGHNFSYIIEDPTLNQQFMSLPTQLVCEILGSNDLVIRDKLTALPTRPAKREKFVLDFILNYVKELPDSTGEVIPCLLSCVKWPILNIFGEDNFVVNNFAAVLDNGNRKAEVEKLFCIEHSDWFLNPSGSPTEEDKCMYSTRAFSCSELISLAPMANGDEIMRAVAGHNLVRTEPLPFCVYADEDDCLLRLEVVTRMWDGREVIGGISFLTSGGNFYEVGVINICGYNVHTIDLQEDEHITKVHGNCGWLIDSLKFESSKERTFGPYGGDGGGKRNLMETIDEYHEEGVYFPIKTRNWTQSISPGPHRRDALDSYLVGVMGKQVSTRGELSITHLRFIFRELLCSHFLMSSENKCEVVLHDSNIHFQNIYKSSNYSVGPSSGRPSFKKKCSNMVQKFFHKS